MTPSLSKRQLPITPEVRAALLGAGASELRYWQIRFGGVEHRTEYRVISAREPINPAAEPEPRWHLSVVGQNDVPVWAHLVAIAHDLRPGVCFVVGVPPRIWWMNIHPHCLHLWETRDHELMEQWRAEASGHRPT